MATTSVTIEADANGKPLEVLSDLIEKRRAAMNETTAQAVTATAINILKSTRAATPVASTANARSGFIVEARTSLVPGFKSAPGAKSGRRVVRAEGGHEITSLKTINLAGQYTKGESVLAFICVFKYRQIRLGGDTEKYDRFYVIAKSKAEVEKWAKRKIEYFINLYKGQAKWVLGQAMSRVSQQGYMSEEQLSKLARRVGEGALSVKVANRGYNSGEYHIEVVDSLKYAKAALVGGPGVFDQILMKAANKTAGIINHQISELKFDGKPVETPFPELKGVKVKMT